MAHGVNPYLTHLHSPVTLNQQFTHMQLTGATYPDNMRPIDDLRRHLKSTREAVYARLFPSTPLDIRPNTMFGEERLVTTVSGTYGWGEMTGLEVYVYDAADGALISRTVLPADGCETAAQVQLDAGRSRGGGQAIAEPAQLPVAGKFLAHAAIGN